MIALPIFRSTVVPGKFAVLARNPVSALNNVVLPAFGLPTSASVNSRFGNGGSGAMVIFPNRFARGKISATAPLLELQLFMRRDFPAARNGRVRRLRARRARRARRQCRGASRKRGR